MMQVWQYFLGLGRSGVRSQGAIVDALARAGVDTYTLNPDAPGGPGVLIFDEITQQLYDFLREVSRNGLERVLAVAVSCSALADGGAWSLLQAGASDVFSWDHTQNPAGEVAARFERWDAVDQLVESPLIRNGLVGESRVWKSVLRQVVEAARF